MSLRLNCTYLNSPPLATAKTARATTSPGPVLVSFVPVAGVAGAVEETDGVGAGGVAGLAVAGGVAG